MIKTTNFTYGEIVEDFNQSHLEKIKIKLSKITASEHLPLLCFSSRTKTILFILSFESDPCLLYMVTFSDLKGRKEYKLCVKTERRCARHKQVKTLRRHLKSYITLCNITSCNINEKLENRPATVCALHNKVCNITLCNINEKLENRPATVCALHNKVCNITLCNIMEKWTRNSLRLEATRQQVLFYSCYKPFTR